MFLTPLITKDHSTSTQGAQISGNEASGNYLPLPPLALLLVPLLLYPYPHVSYAFTSNIIKAPHIQASRKTDLRQRSRWQLPATATTSTTKSATATARSPSHLLGAAAAPACLLYTSRSRVHLLERLYTTIGLSYSAFSI